MQKEKAELIGRLYGSRQDMVCRDIVALVGILIEEARMSNDTAEGLVVFRNQGKIEGYKALIDIIIKGLPIFEPKN